MAPARVGHTANATVACLSALDPARHDAYLVLVTLHIVTAIVGFGAVAVNGAYAPSRDGPTEEESKRYFASGGWAEWALLTVPVFGVVALALKPNGGGLLQLWDLTALGVWSAAAGVWWWVVRPAARLVRGALKDPATSPAGHRGVGSAASRLRWGAGVCDVAFVVALGLMVWRPR